MMESIQVYKNRVFGSPFYHNSIVYTDSTGAKHQLEAGPDPLMPDDKSLAKIRVTEDDFDTTRDYSDEPFTAATGTDLSLMWARMEAVATTIDQSNYPYHLGWENSNSFVKTVLDSENLPNAPYEPDYPTPAYDINIFDLNNPGRRPGGGGTGGNYIERLQKWWRDTLRDPLIIDLDGNGFDLIARSDSTTYFTWEDGEFAQNTQWIGEGTGFLAIDANSDGQIEASELFGPSSNDGFGELELLDTNSDGAITASDAQFSDLIVWEDVNSDGHVDSGELLTLASLHITSFSLTTSIAGGPVPLIAQITKDDSSHLTFGDIHLQYDTTYTRYTGSISISTEAAELPQVAGYGQLIDLQRAMTINGDLLDMVENLLTISPADFDAFDTALEAVIFEWAGVSGVEPDSRSEIFDSQRLGVIETVLGTKFNSHSEEGPWAGPQGITLTKAWEALFQGIKARILVQSPLSDMSDKFHYSPLSDVIELTADFNSIIDAIADDAPLDPTLSRSYWINAIVIFNAAVGDAGVFAAAYQGAMIDALTDIAPSYFSESILTAVASGKLTYVNSSDAPLSQSGTIYGTESTDLIILSEANTTVNGLGGGDEIVVGEGLGVTTIAPVHKSDVSSGAIANATLFLTGIDDGDVVVTANSLGQLVLTLNGSGDTVVIAGAGDDSFGVQDITFDDGTTWDTTELVPTNTSGTTGDDVLFGTALANIFDGHGGTDYVAGLGGGDTFIFNEGYGVLTIDEKSQPGSAKNTLQLGAGIDPEDVAVTSNGVDIILTIGSNGDVITLSKMFVNQSYGVQEISFDDGTIWSKQDIINKETSGSLNSDNIFGTSAAEILDGLGGNDTINGGGGDDAFVFNSGYGRLTIIQEGGPGADSTLILGPGITPSSIIVSAVVTADGGAPRDIHIKVGAGGDEIVLKNMLQGEAFGIQTLTFNDGTIWGWHDIVNRLATGGEGNDHLYGSAADDIFDGGAGNDTLFGHAADGIFFGSGGTDTILFGLGDGADQFYKVRNPKASNVTVKFDEGIDASDIDWHFTRDFGTGRDITAHISGTGDSITIKEALANGTLQFEFADGTVISNEELVEWTFTGTSGDDYIVGESDPGFTFTGGAGDDFLAQPGGFSGAANTYVFNVGDGRDIITDTYGTAIISFGAGIVAGDISFERFENAWASYYLIKVGTSGDQILLDENTTVAEVVFDGGGSLTWSELLEDVTDVDYITGEHIDTTAGNSTVSSASKIYLHNVDPLDVKVVSIKNLNGVYDDAIVIYANGNTIVDTTFFTIPTIEFDDSTIWSPAHVQSLLDASWQGSAANPSEYSIADGWVSFLSREMSVFSFNDVNSDEVFFRRTNGGSYESNLSVDVFNGVDAGHLDIRGALDRYSDVGYQQIAGFYFADDVTLSLDQIKQLIIESEQSDGADRLLGFYGSDTLEGGLGDDVISGFAGADTYIWTIGDGNDLVKDGTSNDGDDRLILHGVTPDDVVVTLGAPGDDLWTLTIGREKLTLADEIEFIEFDDETVWDSAEVGLRATGGFGSVVTETGTAGNDTLSGTTGNDVVDGGAGNDTLVASEGNDLFFFGAGSGNDSIDETGAPDRVYGTDGIKLVDLNPEDVTVSRSSNGFAIKINATGETISVNSFEGLERIFFDDGTVWTAADIFANAWWRGTSGAETLSGGTLNETLFGDEGDDQLNGGSGSDTYIWRIGDGNDSISDIGSSTDIDTLRLRGVDPNDVFLARDGGSVEVVIGSTDERITLVGQSFYAPDEGIERIVFDDNTVWDLEYIQNHLIVVGTQGADILYGGDDADTLQGRQGDDFLDGGADGDTYKYFFGDGSDEIREVAGTGVDTLSLVDINAAEVQYELDDRDLLLKTADGSEIRLKHEFARELGPVNLGETEFTDPGAGIEEIAFADATVSKDDIRTAFFGSLVAGTSAGDTVTGTGANELLAGYDGNDTLVGGAGRDTLAGGRGADTYTFDIGAGQDTVIDRQYASEDNTLAFGAGILTSDIQVGHTANGNIALTLHNGGDSVVLVVDPEDGDPIQEITFADSTVWTMDDLRDRLDDGVDIVGSSLGETFYGSDAADTIDGGGGADIVVAHGGGDTFVFSSGYGVLTIDEDESNFETNVLQFGAGIGVEDLDISVNSSFDLIITVGTNGDQVILKGMVSDAWRGVQEIHFSDTTSLSRADLLNMVPSVPVTGTVGNDEIHGTSLNDLIDGLGGDDIVYGGEGADTYIFNQGYGQLWIEDNAVGVNYSNRLLLGPGIDPNDVVISTDGYGDIVLTIGSNGDQITLHNQNAGMGLGVQEVVFDDSTTWTAEDLHLPTFIGTAGDDTIITSEFADHIDGLGSDTGDHVYSYGGGDTFVFNSGYGELWIHEFGNGATDVLALGAGIDTSDVSFGYDGNDIVMTIGTSGDVVHLVGMATGYGMGIQEIHFDDTTVWTTQDIWPLLVDNVDGTTGGDSLEGRAGKDIFDGLGGNDEIYGWGGPDVFKFEIGYGQLRITEYEDATGSDLQFGVGIDPNDVVLSANSNGDLILTVGTNGDEVTLVGQNYQAWGIWQVSFADSTVWTYEDLYASYLTASVGDDTLFGTTGADVFDGLGADWYDYVVGKGGGDTFVFNLGYGELDIDQTDLGPNPNNTLAFGAGIDPDDVVAVIDEWGDLVLTIGESDDIVYVYGMGLNPIYGVQQVTFDDGTIWAGDSLRREALMGSEGNNFLTGTSEAETFDGAGGVDTVAGGGGEDTYLFKSGYGSLTIDNTGGSDPHSVLEFGPGISDQDLWFMQSGDDLLVQTVGSTDVVTVSDWFGSDDSAQLSAITLNADEQVDTGLNALISAMATFANDNPGFDPAAASSMPTDTTLQTAIAAAWH